MARSHEADEGESLLAIVGRFLARWRTASLATVDERGRPHAANVQFAVDGTSIVWASRPEAAHSRDIERTGRVAITVYAHETKPHRIRGVQMHAAARRVEPDSVRAIYERRFPFVADPDFAGRLASQAFYRAEPTWLRWIDNRQGFGFSREWAAG